MQDIHSLGSGGGGGGPIFGGGIDRRLRPHNALNHHQALKCPRCESLNTKFCYYNNYNLSQPRHFCKGCRRYWTKGGVLRNVPVGGGCRKTKRSTKPKQPPQPSSASDATATTAAVAPPRKSSSHSSSESSSLTAPTTSAATEVVSGGSSSNSAPALFKFPPNSQFFIPQSTNHNYDPPFDQLSDGGSMFPEIGTFTGLMTSLNDPPPLGFNVADISSYRLENQNQGKVVENQSSNQHLQVMTGCLDQTAQIEYFGSENRISSGGLAGIDWRADGGDGDQGMFDLTGTVDQAYWSQTQWPDHNDHSFQYLP